MRFCLQFLIKQSVQTFFSSASGGKKQATLGSLVEKQKCFLIATRFQSSGVQRQCPGPQYSSGLLECKSRKYESIMLGGTPCKRSLQKERPPRKDKKEKAKSKLSTREKSLKQRPLDQLSANVTNYVSVSYKDSFSPYLEISPVQYIQNLKHSAMRRKSKFPADAQQFFVPYLV